MRRWHLVKLSLRLNIHINSFVCVLILRDLDVLRLLVVLLRGDVRMGGWFRFSARSS